MKNYFFLVMCLGGLLTACQSNWRDEKETQPGQMSVLEMSDRMRLKDLMDRYATESDKGNHEYYREIFSPDLNMQIYMGENMILEFDNLDDMVKAFSAAGMSKASFHQVGQQVIDFTGETHATGISYLIAHVVNEVDGKDQLTQHTLRYYDTFVKIDGRWWIKSRKQYFVTSTVPPLAF